MTAELGDAAFLGMQCLGLPLERALALCRAGEWEPQVIYTGERAAEEGLTPRVIAFRQNALIAAYFRDGDPREEA